MTDGWYYLNNNVTVDGRVLLTGDTNLILGNGHTLDVKGIFVPQGSTLTIYAQRNDKDAGSIISTPAGGAATMEEAIAEGLAAGEPKSALAKRVAKLFSVSKSEAYEAILAASQRD